MSAPQKSILNAIKAAITANPGAAETIYLAIDANHMPVERSVGCGILDDGAEYETYTRSEIDLSMTVTLILSMPLTDDDTAITGDTLTTGLLDYAAQLRDLLTDNDLGLSGIESAVPVMESGIEVVGLSGRGFAAVMKTLTIKYAYREDL